MYGTLDDKINIPPIDPAAIDQQQQQRSSTSSLEQTANGSADDQAAAAAAAAERRKRKKIYSHCHVQSEESPGGAAPSGVDKSARRRLIAASVICLIFMIGEVVGGLLSNSLAIATDAAHLLTDFASFMISLFAIWLSSRPATRKMSFGWYRAEVIGALLSVLMIWLVTGLLVYLAIERLRTQEFEIDSLVMVITASAGLLVNIIMAVALHADGHGHGHGHFHSHGAHDHSHGGHSHSHDIHGHNHLEHLEDDDDDGVEFDDDDHDHDHHHRGQLAGQLQQSHHVSIDCSMKTTLTSKMANGTHQDQEKGVAFSHGKDVRRAQANEDEEEEEEEEEIKKRKKIKAKCRGGEGPALAGRGKSNINVRAAFVHVVGDFLQSLGVLIAALVIHFEPSYAIVDPICTFLFSFIVLVTTINIIRDAVNVLMEGIPDGINFIEVREKLQSEPYVIRVHNLRIWSLSLDKIAISTHLVIDAEQITSAQALRRAIGLLKSSYNFFEVTIQIEEYQKDMKDCEHCQDDDSVNVNAVTSYGQSQASPGGTTTPPKSVLT